MWMGGYPPLGYDVKDRKLVVNEAEAETVRYIFRRYRELCSVRLLKEHLDAGGIVVSKRRMAPDGRLHGGKPIARGALYLILQNRIYRGEIVHKHQGHCHINRKFAGQMTMAAMVHAATVAWRHVSIA